MSRPPLLPFTRETALQKVRAAEDAWNTRDAARVSLAYTEDSRWRNRSEFLEGRAAIVAILERKWARELEYRLVKDVWALRACRADRRETRRITHVAQNASAAKPAHRGRNQQRQDRPGKHFVHRHPPQLTAPRTISRIPVIACKRRRSPTSGASIGPSSHRPAHRFDRHTMLPSSRIRRFASSQPATSRCSS